MSEVKRSLLEAVNLDGNGDASTVIEGNGARSVLQTGDQPSHGRGGVALQNLRCVHLVPPTPRRVPHGGWIGSMHAA